MTEVLEYIEARSPSGAENEGDGYRASLIYSLTIQTAAAPSTRAISAASW
jgi:hypothetical protein